jgi:hypothetical protein
MRRVLLLSLLIPAAGPFATPAPAANARAASVKLLGCVPALEPADRTATFEARMRASAASDRMQLRFTLQTRVGVAVNWRRVVADGLGEWLTSAPLVSRYSYAKTVENLADHASYRMLVRFRWLDADGEVIGHARAVSRACRQPDMRPDLRPTRIEDVRAADGAASYHVTVRNAGRTAAGPFDVGLSVGGVVLAPLTLAGLEPGATGTVVFGGPPCAPGAPLVATADVAASVDERDERSNVLVTTCAAVAARRASA